MIGKLDHTSPRNTDLYSTSMLLNDHRLTKSKINEIIDILNSSLYTPRFEIEGDKK